MWGCGGEGRNAGNDNVVSPEPSQNSCRGEKETCFKRRVFPRKLFFFSFSPESVIEDSPKYILEISCDPRPTCIAHCLSTKLRNSQSFMASFRVSEVVVRGGILSGKRAGLAVIMEIAVVMAHASGCCFWRRLSMHRLIRVT